MKYSSTALFVSDISVSKDFYHNIIGLEIMMDNGEHVAFVSGLSIWDRVSAGNVIFQKEIALSSDYRVDICFDSENIKDDYEVLAKAGTEIINPLTEQPWGQLSCRLLDPDGNIVEVAEKITDTFKRLLDSGLSMAELSKKTHTTEADIKKLLSIP
ncbi:MAG: hypothetical protein C0603_02825 [Denitrovibrio sp.]|nr:MAG: hypothetical protein C0603_02825 [Denitrovibrio sp.]